MVISLEHQSFISVWELDLQQDFGVFAVLFSSTELGGVLIFIILTT